jgi:DNA-binding Lrp family transcriptional regulator
MRTAEERTHEPLAGRLDDRVLTALQALSGKLAFSGLRRVLGAHPESLSRSLRRLEREGLVQRVDGGYRALAAPPRVDERSDQGLRAIARIDVPNATDPRAFLGRLAGRWFGTLRWVGLLERPEGELLAWARRQGGGLVLLGLQRGVLSVYASTGNEDDDLGEAEEAAYELLYHAAEALRPTPEASAAPLAPVRTFVLDAPAPSWAG